jgi:hypothetical protein
MEVAVADNPDESRYEVRVDGELAGFTAYRLLGARIVFTHSEVSDAYEGQGVGSGLARGALDDARERGLVVVPLCPFIAGYISGHESYQDLVAPEHRERVAGARGA